MKHTETDIIIAGAGPSGIAAASGAASESVCGKILILEKTNAPGKKLSITGKGRCNITNTASRKEFIQAFGKNGKFLYNCFSVFFREELLDLLGEAGVETAAERGGRVFPSNCGAPELTGQLLKFINKKGAVIKTGAPVKEIIKRGNQITGVRTENSEYSCSRLILATGGRSYPGTGSTGDGYTLARAAGHSVTKIFPSLTGLLSEAPFCRELQGLSLRNSALKLFSSGKAIFEEFGEMLFTHYGISGPAVLTLSRESVPLLKNGEKCEISIDLKPALSHDQLDNRLRREFESGGSKKYKNILKTLLPSGMIPVFINLTEIPEDTEGCRINSKQRTRLRKLLKDFRIPLSGYRGWHEAIVTRGGVNIKEINPKTMESKILNGLYICGELLDIDAVTGGYNLQAAFSTGWSAGKAAAEALL
ncbi:MAG: NAD(P)/FAD-dependent oxidoreductase [Fibrobacterota bacterium]